MQLYFIHCPFSSVWDVKFHSGFFLIISGCCTIIMYKAHFVTTKTDAKFHVKDLSKTIFFKFHPSSRYTKIQKVTHSDYVSNVENLLCVESFKVLSLYRLEVYKIGETRQNFNKDKLK
jgi:hypothetical protein